MKKLREHQILLPIPAFSNQFDIKTKHRFFLTVMIHQKFYLTNGTGKIACNWNNKIWKYPWMCLFGSDVPESFLSS